MKKVILATMVMASVTAGAQGFLKNVQKAVKTVQSKSLSETDAANGIKEALIKGTNESVKATSAADGYLKNPLIKIPFPEDARNVETKLRAMGMGKQVDEAITSINRAAEDAAKDAGNIFATAVKNISVNDAVNIVKGNNDAATTYLKTNTSTELNAKFQPTIKTSLDKVNATKCWTDLINIYNKIPLVKKVNPDLTSYVTGKAIDGLFLMIAQEEGKIRKDPTARTSELLKKVFGN